MAITIVVHTEAARGALTAESWRSETLDFWAFDRHADNLAARGEPLHVVAPLADACAIAYELEIRVQRLAGIRTSATRTPWFDRLLVEHRALHDLSLPLVRADYDHGLDAWQWTLRLDPDAGAAVQLAALAHDLERLDSEAGARIEHLAVDYQQFKDAHARAGARHARALFDSAHVPPAIAEEAAALVGVHERTDDGDAIRAVNDADALSFFSLNSPGYLAYFGVPQTAKKVAYTLARMSDVARAHLPAIRMPRVVRSMVEDHRA